MIKTMFQDGEKGEAVNLEVKLGHLASNSITRMLLNERYCRIQIPNLLEINDLS
jgi:hypothetical protein